MRGMQVNEAIARLQALGDSTVRQRNFRAGCRSAQFGVKMGDIRALAKEIKVNHELGLELWGSTNIDGQFLAILLFKPKQLSAEDVEDMTCEINFSPLADWFTTYVTKKHPAKESLRVKWMADGFRPLQRAGWSLTTERVYKQPEGLDLSALLDRIERELVDAPEEVRWTMNYCLAAIGIESPEHRERAVEIGERLGVYRDYPTPKGCTSPFAPIWIREMVRRQG